MLAASYLFYSAASPTFCILLAGVTLGNQAAAQLIHRTDDERAAQASSSPSRSRSTSARSASSSTTGSSPRRPTRCSPTSASGCRCRSRRSRCRSASASSSSRRSPTPSTSTGGCCRRPRRSTSGCTSASSRTSSPARSCGRASSCPSWRPPRDPRQVAVGAGVALIVIGLVKKVAIADYLAREVVDPVFDVPQAYSAPGRHPRLRTPTPCRSSATSRATRTSPSGSRCSWASSSRRTSTARTARRASASSGGAGTSRSRASCATSSTSRSAATATASCRQARNLMITMVLGGLWHGAAWGFVLWGFIHGSALVVENVFRGRISPPAWLKWFLTFHLVVLAWIPFRAPGPAPRRRLRLAARAPGRRRRCGSVPVVLVVAARHRPAAHAPATADGRPARTLRAPASGRARRDAWRWSSCS